MRHYFRHIFTAFILMLRFFKCVFEPFFDDLSGATPALNLEEFFEGETIADGILKIVSAHYGGNSRSILKEQLKVMC